MIDDIHITVIVLKQNKIELHPEVHKKLHKKSHKKLHKTKIFINFKICVIFFRETKINRV